MNYDRQNPDAMLIRDSATAMTDSDLIAALLRIDQSAAYSLLRQFGSLRALLDATTEDVQRHDGIGRARAVQLKACAALARRYMAEKAMRDGDSMTSPDATRRFLRAHLRDERNEVFCALFLDCRHRVTSFERLFNGTIDAAHVHPRVVVERAIQCRAAAVIVAHNHPSGNPEPSQADLAITRRLRDALALLDIRLLDHFIVGDEDVTSLAERGLV